MIEIPLKLKFCWRTPSTCGIYPLATRWKHTFILINILQVRSSKDSHNVIVLEEDPVRTEPTTAEICQRKITASGRIEPSAQDLYMNCVAPKSEKTFCQSFESHGAASLQLKGANESESSDSSRTEELQPTFPKGI